MALPLLAAAGGLKGALGGAAAGSVSLIGSIDVSSITRGLGSMKEGLGKVKGVAKESFGDMERLMGPIKGLSKGLLGVAVGAAAPALGIAALSPQVAPVLARMKVDFDKLSRVLGQELKPVFEAVGNAFRGFVDFVDTKGRGVIQAVVGAFQSFWTVLGDVWAILEDTGTIDNALEFLEDLTNGVKGFFDELHNVLTGEKSLADIIFDWGANSLTALAGWFGHLVGGISYFIENFDWSKFGEAIWNGILGIGEGAGAGLEGLGLSMGILGLDMAEAFSEGFNQGSTGKALDISVNKESNAREEAVKIYNQVHGYNNSDQNYSLLTRYSNIGGG